MEMKGLAGGFYRISEWIMRLSAINLLWLFCSLPVVFLTAMQLIAVMGIEEWGSIYVLAFNPFGLASLLIAPFTFFPATAAMFAVARKWVTGDADVPLFRSFFRYFKENYKAGLLGGFVFEFLYVVFLVNFQFYTDQTNWLANLNLVFLVFLALLAAAVLNYFCYVAHFDLPFGKLLRNSVLITIAKLPNTISILAVSGVILYISLQPRFLFLAIFFTGSVIAMFTFWSFHRMVTKIQEKIAEREEAERAAAEAAGGDGTGEAEADGQPAASGAAKDDGGPDSAEAAADGSSAVPAGPGAADGAAADAGADKRG